MVTRSVSTPRWLCVSNVYELEALLEVVFHRGSKMHDIVPRDAQGRSNYRLAAIRPSQIDLADDDVHRLHRRDRERILESFFRS